MDIGAAVAYGSHKADKPMELESIKRAVVTASHVLCPPRHRGRVQPCGDDTRRNEFARADVQRD